MSSETICFVTTSNILSIAIRSSSDFRVFWLLLYIFNALAFNFTFTFNLILHFPNTTFPKYYASPILRFPNTTFPKYYASQILRFPNTTLHKNYVSQILRFTNTTFPKYYVSQILRFTQNTPTSEFRPIFYSSNIHCT